jgi:glycosyltransferase involved in cell wall biosynthesis
VHPDPGVSAGNGEYAIFIGRLAHEKRVDTILNAWANLTKRIELFIVGDGPDANELQREAGLRGLSTVHFQGHLPREQAMVFLRNARFLIFSSKLYETFGLTIIEAFACGIPVICSKMGAMQEIVDDGRTGLHFIPGNAVDLAAKVEWACNHPERMQEMGKEARKEYESKYSAEKNYPLLMNIYQHAIAQHSSQRVSLECKETVPERSTLN